MKDGELLLNDSGAEYGFYATDITRTYPVNGQFSPEQRAIYEIVLAAQKAAMALVKPGATHEDIEKKAAEVAGGRASSSSACCPAIRPSSSRRARATAAHPPRRLALGGPRRARRRRLRASRAGQVARAGAGDGLHDRARHLHPGEHRRASIRSGGTSACGSRTRSSSRRTASTACPAARRARSRRSRRRSSRAGRSRRAGRRVPARRLGPSPARGSRTVSSPDVAARSASRARSRRPPGPRRGFLERADGDVAAAHDPGEAVLEVAGPAGRHLLEELGQPRVAALGEEEHVEGVADRVARRAR